MTTTKAGSRDLSSRKGEDFVVARVMDASASMRNGVHNGVGAVVDSSISTSSGHEELFVPESWTRKHPAVEASASMASTCASPGAKRERAMDDEAIGDAVRNA